MFSVKGIQNADGRKANNFYHILAWIGVMSYSIFVWHQVAIAYYKYAITYSMQASDYLILLTIISVISLISYYGFEKFSLSWKSKRQINRIVYSSFIAAICLIVTGLYLYVKAGVYYDIPELEITKNNVHRGMHGEYCDRVYALDKDFEENGKIKVFGYGDSFVRDWFNVMLESEYADSLDYSYCFVSSPNNNEAKYISRLKEADIVFTNTYPDEIKYSRFKEALQSHPNVVGVGTKNFGESNGYPFMRRNTDNYFNIRLPRMEIHGNYADEKKYYGDKYIDFIAPVIDENEMMPVFTDDSLYIAPDCRHLSHGGARYYAKILDVPSIIKKFSNTQSKTN